ncbi:MAG TPA: spondin domain-containing protein, partial [Nannocystaceae bacterium]|nr:spondin domain-containing protein [Nannocystaceae bacterium]
MTYRHASLGMLAVLAITGCPDDATPADTDTETGSSSSGESSNTNPTTTTATTADTSTSATTADSSSSDDGSSTTPPEESSSSEGGPDLMPAEFEVTIENISGTSTLPTTISAGVWLEQELGTQPVFSADAADRGEGLVALAEDGDPAALAASVMDADGWVQSGTWDMAIGPGESTSFTLTADPGSGPGLANRLGFMAGLGAGNDVFIGTGPNGIALFTNGGLPMDDHDVSDVLALWDVGTEYNQAPGQGFDQQQTQAAADTGMAESGTVWAFSSSTRALPQASKLLTWDVTHDMKNPDTVIITLTNTSTTLEGDFGDLVWALHDDTASIFTAGGAASDVAGLEELAEDGDGAAYQATLAGTAGVASADLIAGGVGPGETFVITVTPDGANRFLSFATSLAATNDAFVAPAPVGIA